MAFRIESDPGALLARLQPQVPNPDEMEANALKLQQMRNEASLFPLKQQEAGLQIQTEQMNLEERKRQLDELKAYQGIMGKYAGDYEKARPELSQVMRPKTLADIDNVYLNRAKTVSDINEKNAQASKIAREAQEALQEEYGGLAEHVIGSENPYATMDAGLVLMERNHPEKAQQIEAVRQQFAQNPDDALRLAEGLRTPKSRAASQELASKKAQQDKEAADTALTKAQTPGAQAKSDIEVQQANALKTMNDQNWSDYINRVIEDHNSPLYRRTVQMVDFYRKQGNLKAADDAVKAAGEQLGKTESAVATAKATLPTRIEIAAATAGARAQAGMDAAGLNEDDFKRAGEEWKRTGVMPALGRDSATRGKIVHYGNEWARDNGLTAADTVMMQAAYKGDVESLKKFQAQRDQIVSFEQTAQKNLDLFLNQASKIVDSGVPWINRPLRTLGAGLGSTDLAAVNAARQIANNEIAKVTSGGGLSGVLSDSARHEVQDYNPKEATFKQTVAVANILKQDMANRHGSMDATLADIRSRIGGQSGGGGRGNAGGGGHVIEIGGKHYRYNGTGATNDLKNYTEIPNVR